MNRALERLPSGDRAWAWAGIVLGMLAFWVAVPPLTLRTLVPSALLALAAITVGAIMIRRGTVRLGVGAIVSGVVCLTLAYLAQRSSVSNLQAVVVWSALLAATLRFATPLIYAAIGGMFSERSGVVNIGLEGMMLMGAFFGIMGADKTDSWVLGLLIAIAAGGALALVHAVFSIHLQADQIVGGTAVNFLALGITGYLFIDIYGTAGTPSEVPEVPNVTIPGLEHVYFIGPAIGQANLLIWLALATIFVSWIVMFKTPLGLRIRSVGEHPRAADTVGISVYGIRYAAVVVSGMLAAVGGAYLSIGFVHSFNENMTAGRGFIALAALIFGNWRPFGAAGAALLFGFSSALAQRMSVYNETLPGIDVLIQALPYVLTLIAVAGVIGRTIPPAAVGRPYAKA
jgi:general nucleoside transport system permease protein